MGDGYADIDARQRAVSREHLGLQVDRQGKARPVSKGKAERLGRRPQVACNERLGRRERPDIEVKPAECLTHFAQRQPSVSQFGDDLRKISGSDHAAGQDVEDTIRAGLII